ncbi:MAG: prephenate dehydratase domain-containing protein [Oscillospiraceae bacterium]
MDINDFRNSINGIDDEIISLFKKRMAISLKIAEYKKQNNLPILDKARERELLKSVAEKSGDELSLYATMLYSTMFSVSRSYQQKCLNEKSSLLDNVKMSIANSRDKCFPENAVVACQGVEGAYSSLAAEKLFKRPDIMFFKTFDDVFSAVDKGLCKYGMLPIENSTAGSVNRVYDLMSEHHFYIVRSQRLKIEHSLLSKNNTSLKEIKEIYSHEQAINQCSEFLKTIANVKINIVENTAVAAKIVMESDRNDIAAISSNDCAELYNLNIILKSIQNNDNNYTRFICISKDLEIYSGAEKTSLMMTLAHRAGSLYDVMSKFYALSINLQKIESRPIPGTDFEFMFYFDVDISVNSAEFPLFIEEVGAMGNSTIYLGSYNEII